MQEWKPDVMVFGPGGVKGFLHLGSVLKFQETDFMSQVSEYRGCSVGSAISLLTVSGYTSGEIINDFMNLSILDDIANIKIDCLMDNSGLIHNKTTEDLLTSRMIDKYGEVPTLSELYNETGKLLILVTYNIDKLESTYLSKDTHPNLSSVKGVMMSMAMPGMIIPISHEGNDYVDGAVGDPYPILYDDTGQKNILGVYIESQNSSIYNSKNLFTSLFRCSQGAMKQLRDYNIKFSSDSCKHICLKTSIVDATGITTNNKNKIDMINEGYKTTSLFLLRLKNPVKYRLVLNENEEIPVDNSEDQEVQEVPDRETRHVLDILTNNFITPTDTEDIFINLV